MTNTTTAIRIEAALDLLRIRYVERDSFLSDSDVLDAAAEVAGVRPGDYDAEDQGDIEAICRLTEASVIADILFEKLTD